MDDPLDQLEDNHEKEDLAFGWKALCFIIPLAGAIIFFNHQSTNQRKSKSACIAALCGVGLNIVLRLVSAGLG